MHEPSLYPGSDSVDLFDAPHETTGVVGVIGKTLPSGLQIHYLGLDQAQWQTGIMMHAKDLTSTHAGVCTIDVDHTLMSTSAASHERSAKDAATIKSWHNRIFYLTDVGVPGLLAFYTPSSQARTADSAVTDKTTFLVPVIPDLAPVRISTRSLTLAPLDDTAPKWSRNFLREEILWIAHYRPTPHATKTETVDSTMRQAWWPAIEACAVQCHKHCAICTQDIDVEKNVGIGIKSCSRFTWLVVDSKIDKILPSCIAEHTTYVSVLPMIDPASGGMGALEASAIVFCNWICRYDIPTEISSDNHGAFKAEVVQLICRILGVENSVFSAVYQSRSHAHVGNRNKIISEAFSDAVAKGGINNDLDAELYLAEAEIKANQLITTDRSTTFERCSGQAPRIVNASLSAPSMEADEIEGCIERMNARPYMTTVGW